MRRLSSESGAVLMNVILAMVLLIGINTFVIDYGVMWVGRGQAQNAADAGALAGAVAMAFDDYNDRLDTGPAKRSAYETTQQNSIWGTAPAVNITNDVTFPTVPANPCADSSCIRVDVYRNVARGNPLPALFGTAIGLTSQGVRAMAIARAAAANASDCLKPWAVPDKWTDNHDDNNDGGWTDDDSFETEDKKGSPLPDPDVYVAPTQDSPGTGFTVAADLGVKVTLKTGSPQDALAPGVFHPIQLPLAGGGVSSGGADYRNTIAGCAGAAVGVGATLGMENGNMIGPTKQGVDDLIALDKDATWDATEKAVKNSCAQATTPCAARSPRIVAIPVFDTGAYYAASKQNGNVSVKVVNILGFFIDKMQGNDVVGYITTVPGLLVNGPSVGNQSGFAKVVMLVR
jgi:Flp pilus assembly protein TadG